MPARKKRAPDLAPPGMNLGDVKAQKAFFERKKRQAQAGLDAIRKRSARLRDLKQGFRKLD